MIKLDINLLAPPHTSVPVWMPASLFCLIALITHALWSGYSDRMAYVVQSNQVRQFPEEKRIRSVSLMSWKDSPVQTYIADSITKIDRPWIERLSTLQRVNGNGIQLTAIESQSNQDKMALSGRAESALVLLNYLNRLAGSDLVSRAKITSHNPFISRPGDEYGLTPPLLEFSIDIDWLIAQ